MTSKPTPTSAHHHRISLVCVNDVYSFDDLDSSTAAIPRGGWCRAATLMKRLGQKNKKKNDPTSTTAAAAALGNERCCNDDQDNDNVDNENELETTTTVLTVVNGDVLGGSSLLQHSHGSAAIEVMNSIPIDLAVLGNHEFDYGDEVLMRRVKESEFVWLGSNVYYPRQCQGFKLLDVDCGDNVADDYLPMFQESVIASESSRDDDTHYFPGIHGNGKMYTLAPNLKLGVFGLVTKVTPKISNPSKKVIFDPDILAVARRTTRKLREEGGVGVGGSGAQTRMIIIAITHMSEAEDRLLAADKLAGVDLVLGGHEHEPMADMIHRNDDVVIDDEDTNDEAVADGGGDGREGKHINEGGVLVFKCGMNAYWVGTVDLDIVTTPTTTTNGSEENNNPNVATTTTSISTSWSMHSVTSSTAEEDPAISEIVKRNRKESDESALVTAFGEEIARTLCLDDVIARIGGDGDTANNLGDDGATTTTSITPAAATMLLPLDTRMSSVRRREATGGNLVADAMHWLMKTSIRTEINNNSHINNNSSSFPMLAMINGGFIRGDRLRGVGTDFTVRDVLTELPFPRTMKVLTIEGRHLKKAMAQQLNGSSKGPTGAYPHLSSNARLSYRLGSCSSDSIASNDDELISILTFTVDGVELCDRQKYNIAVTSFVADGNEGCSSWLESTRVHNTGWDELNLSCVLLKYLQWKRAIYPVLEYRVSQK